MATDTPKESTMTTETSRKIDLTDGRDVLADLRAQIAEARRIVDNLDMTDITDDEDLLATLDAAGLWLSNDQQPDGIMWRQSLGWEPSDTAVTIDMTAPFEAWATTAAWEITDEDGHRWTESTDGITVVEGSDEIGGW